MKRSGGLVRVLVPVALIACLLVLWELFVVVRGVQEFVLPKPTAILGAFTSKPTVFLRYGWNTLKEALGGLAVGFVIGAAAALVTHRSLWASRLLGVYSTAAMSLPIVALIPLANIFLGQTTKSRIAVVVVATAPIFVVYVGKGLRAVDPGLLEMFSSLSASLPRRIWSLYSPSAVPFVMSGLRVATPTAYTVAILAEYFGGPLNTLGSFMKSSSVLVRVDDVWGSVFVAFFFSTAIFLVLAAIDRMALHWKPRTR